jgi:hypothetical protein
MLVEGEQADDASGDAGEALALPDEAQLVNVLLTRLGERILLHI